MDDCSSASSILSYSEFKMFTSHLKAASQISVLQCHREQVKSGEEKDGGRNQTFIDDSLCDSL